MAFFSRDRGKEVPKGVPPDKSAGAWPSEQENITGSGNVGKSPWEEYVRRVNDAKSRLKVQDKRRKHHAVNHQEDTPHGECPVNDVELPLPRPRCNLETLSPKEIKPIHEPTRPRSVPAGIAQDTSHKHHVGKSPCGGTNAENQSLKAQENPREHSVVANQEDIPTGDRAGIHPLPNALDLEAEMNSIIEMYHKHQSYIMNVLVTVPWKP